MSVFTNPSSSNPNCSLSKTSSKQSESSSSYGFLDAIFGCFASKSNNKSRQLQNRPTTPLLGVQEERFKGRKTLVLDLDETLVHTSNAAAGQCFRNMCMRMNGQCIFVAFRPGVKDFLKRMGAIYEIVIFTASLQTYAEQVIKALDDEGVVAHRLYRDSCTVHGNSLVKDLARLNRPLKDIIILDNSMICYEFQPTNGLKIDDFIDDPKDEELAKMVPLLEMLSTVDDVRPIQFWQDECNKTKQTGGNHKNLRISTLSKMKTMTSTDGILTPNTIPMKTGRCHTGLISSPMLVEKEKIEVN